MYLCIMYFYKKPPHERVHMKGDAPFKGEGGGGEKKREKTRRLLYMMQNSKKTLKFRNLPLQDQRTNVNQT